MKKTFTCPIEIEVRHTDHVPACEPTIELKRVVIRDATPWYWRIWNRVAPNRAHHFYQAVPVKYTEAELHARRTGEFGRYYTEYRRKVEQGEEDE
jgi:hypothetical protein